MLPARDVRLCYLREVRDCVTCKRCEIVLSARGERSLDCFTYLFYYSVTHYLSNITSIDTH